jgi:outer membrane receptor protein involved in Fe transport
VGKTTRKSSPLRNRSRSTISPTPPVRWPATAPLTTAILAVLACARATAAEGDSTGLTEIVVTATRHSMSVQDVPYSISAMTGASLEDHGIVDIAGLAAWVPGVVYSDKGPYGGVSGSNLIIRGLNSAPTFQLALANPVVPPVSTYIDETPLFVNLRLKDLDRVEVLRGPQGTLYGSGSLGGTVRFVQNAPNPDAFESKVDAGVSSTAHTHGVNYDIDAVLNLPLSPTFAVRLNGSYTDEAGYIDQPNLYRLNAAGVPVLSNPADLLSPPVIYRDTGVNNYGYRTGRIAALWKPGDSFHAQLSYYYQQSEAGGFPYNSPAIYGPRSLDSADNVREPTNDKVDLVALTLEGDVDFARLTAASSWFKHRNDTTTDLTGLYQNFPSFTAYYGSNPRALVVGHDALDDEAWVQEIRLTSKEGGPADWVVGLFYENQTTDIADHEFYPGYNDYFNACAQQFGAGAVQCGFGEYYGVAPQIDGIPIVKDQAYIGDVQTRFRDAAAFGEFTWHITPAWQFTGGSRLFKQKTTQSQQTGLLFDGPAFIANQTLEVNNSRALWKLNTSYKLDDTNLVYATWSQGFRRGGVNALPPTEAFGGTTNPILFRVTPDTADNYEVGVKGTLQDRYRYSLAVYDIQWKNIQQPVNLTALAIPGVINIGDGFSRGVELEFDGNLAPHLFGQVSYTYDDTKLTTLSEQALVGSTVPPEVGGRLPGTPQNSAFVDVEYRQSVAGSYEVRYGIDGHYQSQITPSLTATNPRAGGYTTVDTNLTVLKDSWRLALYVDNVTNALAINSYTDPAFFGNRWSGIVYRPRTVGVSFSYAYKGH